MCRCAGAVDGGHVVPLVVVDVVQVCVGGCVDLCLHGDGDGGGERLERHHRRAGGAAGPIRERLERLERRAGDGGGDGQQVVLSVDFWLCAPCKLLLSQPHAHAPNLVGNRCFGQNVPARQG